MGRNRVHRGPCVGFGEVNQGPCSLQRCIDWNRDLLKQELGLSEQDIIDIPQLFQGNEQARAHAFFPDMVTQSCRDGLGRGGGERARCEFRVAHWHPSVRR